jgi:uracil-DNA glycosylase family 4
MQGKVKAGTLPLLQCEIISCTKCPRLVDWREKIAREKVRRFSTDEYWGKPVPSLGVAGARLLVIGLAPAAHGGNRTGRMFTGDRSGDWLYRALHRAGFASQPNSIARGDGLRLRDCYITAAAHCAPPGNRLTPAEIANCRQFLTREVGILTKVRVVVALGRIAFDAALASFRRAAESGGRKPIFGHGVEIDLTEHRVLIASFHPSQQNTFTGKLTERMFDSIFERARQVIDQSD